MYSRWICCQRFGTFDTILHRQKGTRDARKIYIRRIYIFTGFQFIVALTTSDFSMMSKSFMVLSAFLAQLTVYSIVGDYLKTQMEEVAQSVYQCAWYNLPAKVARNIVFIMMWKQLPIKLQAGNFLVVDLGTYMSILKISASYLSVLRVMMDTWNIWYINNISLIRHLEKHYNRILIKLLIILSIYIQL